MYFFTADEHYSHRNIIMHCNRPFESAEEMDSVLIENHNSVVKPGDTVIHAGDFCFSSKQDIAESYLKRLNGNHIVLRGSHDYWLKDGHEIWEKKIDDAYIVVCHYAMRVWSRSHFNSWQLYGHSHGKLDPVGKQWDIGVDNSKFHPVSFQELKLIMAEKPDNPNRLTKLPENFSVSVKYYKELEQSLMSGFEQIEESYAYESKYICGNRLLDSRKINELAHMCRMCNLLTSLSGKFASSGGAPDNQLVPSETLNAMLDFPGSDSSTGKKLKQFMYQCMMQKRVPRALEFDEAMSS